MHAARASNPVTGAMDEGVTRLMMVVSRLLPIFVTTLLVVASAAAQAKEECSGGRGRACNPRQECLAQAERKLKGAALDAARKDCSRMPTSGTCFGGDIPADCAQSQSQRRK